MTDVTLVTYTVSDMATAKRFFRELTGTDPYADARQYVGYKSGGVEIGLVPSADERDGGGLAYWTVPDVAVSVKGLVAAGGTVVQEITDVGYGMLVATVKAPNGATVGLRQSPKG